MGTTEQIPATRDLKFDSGDDFSLDIIFTEDITDDTFKCLLLGDGTVDFTVTPNVSTKTVNILLTRVQTTLLNGTYSWYFERTHQSYTRTLIAGNVKVLAK